MAENMKMTGNSASSAHNTVSSYRDCVCMLLKYLADFGEELKLDDSALKIDVNVDVLDLPSCPSAHVYSILQQHISKLQAVSQSLKTLLQAEHPSPVKQNKTDGHSVCTSDSSHCQAETTALPIQCLPPIPVGHMEVEESKAHIDDITVQIKAGKSEIDRRIFAFMERKQMEINENNVREFCNVIDCNQENSCARTDAIFTPYPGYKSHVKVTRVVNTYGPQTSGGGGHSEVVEHQRPSVATDCGNPATEERLHNIETHLKLPTEGPVPLSVYERLKKLEDRILELEGLSPEYFQSTSYLHKQPRTSSSQGCSLTELDGKITAVKAALLKRVNEFGPGYGTECSL